MQKPKRPAPKNEVAELKHLLEQKNRELEIEAALECVRIVAMRMNQPSDMIDVCRIISEQLQILKVENIRNVQTAIINDEKGTYLNYEFFTQYGTNSILEIKSNLHPKVLEFVNSIKKSKDAFFTTEFKGKNLKDWIEYRRKTNQNSDPILEKAESVHYYFYSIGPGALGLSTYTPLASRELDVFKRFHKVFMLAYQRFLDLQKAEAQAREAQIEAAMERIRNRALVMKDSRELNEVVSVFFNEFSQLDLLPPEARTYFCDINSNTHTAEVWMTYTNGEVMSGSHFTPLTRSASMKKYYEAWKRKEPISIRAYKGKNLDSYISFVSSLPHVKKDKDYKKLFKNPPKQIFMTDANFLQGNIGIMSFDPLSEEALEVLQRFAKVFEFTYTRFLDLQKAEAQAREAQIEAALERVRAHAMGLRKSSDLHNIITVIFEELQKLGLTLYECSIFLRNGDTREFTVWGKSNSDKDKFLTNYQFYFVDHPLLDEVIRDLERQIPFREFSMEQEELKSYADLIFAQTAFKDSPQEYKDSFYALRKVYAGQAIFQHGFLEAVGTEPLPGDLPEVLRRFSQVIDLTYTRFLDLQKAETQAREAEIQLALERVRARTMAMQHSDELSEAAFLLVQQVRELAIKAWGCAFHIYADNENGDYEWFSNEDGYLPFYKTPRKRFFREFYEMRESGETLYVKAFMGKACENHYKYLLSLPVVGDALKDLQNSGAALPSSQIDHVAYFKYGYLLFITYNPVPEAHEIFKRFAKEFEQTYTRFLDLQKAEAQAREAEIQLALERVRARTMAMHKSDELSDTASVMFQELKKLGIKSNRTGVCIFDFDKDTAELWLAAEDGDKTETMVLGTVSAAMHPIYKEWIDAGRQNKKIVRFELSGDELINYYKIANAQLNLPKRTNTVEQEVYYGFIFSGGSINIIAPKLLTEEELDIGYRFANVFGLLYRRFLDLQKAEAQAREAQIEAALERVRSRTMAMQDSNELQEVAALMYEEFIDLGFDQVGQCGYAIIDVINNHQKMWLTQFDGNPMTHFNLPLKGDPLLNNRFNAWESKKPFLYQKVKKSEFSKHLKGVQSGLSAAQIEMARQNMPDPIHFYNAYFNHGYLHVVANHQLNSDQESILLRFTLVFEQTYTRFLDLKKAEAQAREAQIEAALERVRAQTMAMHNSEDVGKCVVKMFAELTALGVDEGTRFGIGILNHDNENNQLWTAKKDGEEVKMHIGNLNMAAHPLLQSARKAWKAQVPLHQYVLEGEDLRNYYQMLNTAPDYNIQIPIEKLPQRELHYGFIFEHGFFYAFSPHEFQPDLIHIIQRFSSVFSQTYRRYLDLVKAEAQAREAQIEAGLERVRASMMAMHKSKELPNVMKVIGEQLIQLSIRMDAVTFSQVRNEKDLKFWTSTTFQTYPVEIIVPYINHPLFNIIYEGMMSGIEFTTILLSEEDVQRWWEQFFEQSNVGALVSPERKAYILSKKGYASSIAIRKYSTLNIVNYEGTPFSEEENTILKRFANVFEQSYTRFLDLKKAEDQAREAQIEAGLERVRAQAMAMHHSDDLGRTIEIFYSQLSELLNTPIIRCGAGILNDENSIAEITTASRASNGGIQSIRGNIDMTGHPLLHNTVNHWRKQEEYYHLLKGEEIKKYYQYMTNQVAIPDFSKDDEQHFYFPMFSEGSFYVITRSQLPETELQVVRRFSTVLSLTYRRFNELKKAEAQTREAQIEAALERIRAKALAMQSSADLHDVSIVLREQMGLLGQEDLESSIVHLYNGSEKLESWYTFRSTETDSVKVVTDVAFIPVDCCEYIRETIEKYKSKEQEYTIVSTGKKLYNWYKVMVDVAPDTIEYNEKGEMIVPKILYYHHSKFLGGALLMISNQPPSEESKELQRRAAKVFNLAYQRFLDLQQAEERARESIKQASLDRVRGEIASMRTKEDLNRITPLVWKELKALKVPFIRCGVFIMDEGNQNIESHLSTPDGKSLGLLNLPFEADSVGNNAVKFWRKGMIYKDHWDQKQFINFMNKMVELGRLENPSLYQGSSSPPDSLDLHFVPFKQGMLYVGNNQPLTDDEIRLVQSLAEAFSIAYARYEDFTQLEQAKDQIESALSELKSTQTQLIHSEKMASLGELTAGIAHEIQNPLNFVNNFSEVSKELIEELKEERAKQSEERDVTLEEEIIEDIIHNLEKINHHGQRASSIVKGMLEHSRSGNREKELTDINNLADEYLRLSYHGLRAKDKTFNADFRSELDPTIPKIRVIGQDIGRVLLNLINNAFYAVSEKLKEGAADYKPEVLLRTKKNDKTIEISVQDNGGGIPKNALDKIFQPFFTTKPTGQGTGLGLSLSYDIITKGHDGHLEVETEEGIGSSFNIQLPIK